MTQYYGALLLTIYILKNLQNVAALECYTCYSDEGFGIHEMPGDWSKFKTKHDKTCKTSHSRTFGYVCHPDDINPSFEASCGKLSFVYINQSSSQRHEITIRGCMATPQEPAEGYCTNLTSLGNLKKLSLFPSDFKKNIEYFPDSTCANVCSCSNRNRCRITGGNVAVENNQYTCGGAGGGSSRLHVWLEMALSLIIIWSNSHSVIME